MTVMSHERPRHDSSFCNNLMDSYLEAKCRLTDCTNVQTLHLYMFVILPQILKRGFNDKGNWEGTRRTYTRDAAKKKFL